MRGNSPGKLCAGRSSGRCTAGRRRRDGGFPAGGGRRESHGSSHGPFR